MIPVIRRNGMGLMSACLVVLGLAVLLVDARIASRVHAQSSTSCGGAEYDPTTQSCCGGQIYSIGSEACCSGQIYTVGTQKCCGTQVYTVGLQDCCSHNVFTVGTQDCCNQQVFTKSTQGCCYVQLDACKYVYERDQDTCCKVCQCLMPNN